MPVFLYEAIDANNKKVSGSGSAADKKELAEQLKAQGLTPLKVKTESKSKKIGSLPIVEKITLCRYLATMLKSGLSLTESVSVLANEAKHPVTKKILDDLKYGLSRGQTLSSVFAQHPETFDTFFIMLVKSGEVSGTLSETFEHIQEEIRAEYSLNQKISSALVYPGVVFTAMIGIGVLMIFFILPSIGEVFLDLGLPLNPLTMAMFNITIAMSGYKYWILLGIGVAIVGLVMFFKTRLGKRFAMMVLTPIPVIRNLIMKIDMARFCRIFSTLLRSGVPITEALEISLDSLSFSKFQNSSGSITETVSQGKTIAASFKDLSVFPPLLIQMMSAGEKSGTLDETLADLASFYEEEVANGVKKLTELLEPMLMLGVGIGVGVMVLAVITPIYSVVSNLSAGM